MQLRQMICVRICLVPSLEHLFKLALWVLLCGVRIRPSVSLDTVLTVKLVMLRSLWTALRIMANFKHTELFRNISVYLGVGFPAIFLAVSLAISGVSYNLGDVCVPYNPSALGTWFAWVLFFATISWIVQLITILYCLWTFARFSFAGPRPTTGNSQKSTPTVASDGYSEHQTPSLTPRHRKRIAWRKVQKVLVLQWRSVIMAFILVNLSIYFGIIFIEHTAASSTQIRTRGPSVDDLTWIACLMANNGDKTQCPYKGAGLGHNEDRAVGTLILGSVCILHMWALIDSMLTGPVNWNHCIPADGPLFYVHWMVGSDSQPKTALPKTERQQ